MKRAIIIVLDSFGIGALPDAEIYGDVGANTLAGIYNHTQLQIPNLKKMGLYNIDGITLPEKEEEVIGAYGKAAEKSAGKNSPVGHWEMAGYIKEQPFSVYYDGFPEELIQRFKQKAKIEGILCNKKGSGTDFLKQYGEEHLKTGFPIVYTSADSVFQIAMHKDLYSIERQYEICEVARKILDEPQYNVGTVIARPFVGDSPENFKRTYERKDFESKNIGTTILDVISEHGKQVVSIGKIRDLFSERGITKAISTQGNADGIEQIIQTIQQNSEGLIFANLVDYDMLYGHRRDIEGYAKALKYFDQKLPEILRAMNKEDLLIITADHGCDPSFKGTDHTREYIPILIAGKFIKPNTNIGIRATYADIAATILDYLNLPSIGTGTSFLPEILLG